MSWRSSEGLCGPGQSEEMRLGRGASENFGVFLIQGLEVGSGGIQIVYLKLLISLSAACFLLSLLGDKSEVPLSPAEL